jgi:hypothetical protein
MTVFSRRARASWLAVAWLLASVVFAGDEVDYSAPYLVVEDGKLVTRYPGQEHQPGAGSEPASADQAAGPGTSPDGAPIADMRSATGWLVGTAVLAAAVGGLLLVRRSRG